MSAKAMFEALQAHNQQLQTAADDQFHLRAPFWWLHLPDGREVKIASFSYSGPLMVFRSFWSTRESHDDYLLLPEAVVLSVRTEDMKSFEGDHAPAEFLEPPEDESA